jgi:uncharacterized protein (TIGR02466 family)
MQQEMEIIRNSLFPTMVYSVKNVLSEDDRKNIVNDINAKTEKQSNLNLFNEQAYQPLINQIAHIVKSWMQDHKWEYDKLFMTGMWFTKIQPGEYHRPHSHGNNYISGVYYPEACDSDGIVFEDPRSQATVITPYALSLNALNSHSWSFPTTENSLLMFPAWLKHHVPPTKTDRSSIAFNLMLSGTVGRETDLQNSEFN